MIVFACYLCASQSHMHVFFIICPINQKCRFWGKTLPKAQRTRGLSSYYRISIKHQLQNFNQTSASQLNLKLNSWPNLASEYWPRFNFVTSSKHQRQNADQTSASKSRLNFNFKQSWLKCSKSEQKLSFMTKPQLPNLQQTVANTILITNISNSNNLNKFWVGIFTRQGHINKVYWTAVS